ncbi:MAG: GspH/FimT family pseudopilin [Caldimonas sp.]
MLRVRPSIRGFTLIEMLVGMTIAGILLALGFPSITAYLQSSKLASASQSYLSGVQIARTEAIRRNAQVQFVLTNTPVETADIANVAAPSTAGQNWIVRWFDTTLLPPAFVLIESKAAAEGSVSTAPSVQIIGTAAPTPFTGIIAFNGFGATSNQDAFQLDMSNPAGGACAPAGPMQCPRIQVPSGGLVHLCNPLVLAANDSRGC